MRTAEEWYEVWKDVVSGQKTPDGLNGCDPISLCRLIQLDAMKEGARRAAQQVASHWNDSSTMVNQKLQALLSCGVILSQSEQWTKKDL